MAGLPTLQETEEWLEQILQDNLPKTIQELPFNIRQTVYAYSEAVYNVLTKYGSPVNLPSLQQIEDHMHSNPFAKCPIAPAPPSPPPFPRGLLIRSADWASAHRRTLVVAGGVAVLGLGTTAAYRCGLLWLPLLGKRHKQTIEAGVRKKLRTPLITNGVRKEAIVVLGADTPLGRALTFHLSAVGFIVIASVSSPAAVSSFNSIVPPSSRGYIKTLLFETSDVTSSLSKFVRSVDEVLKLRFPLLSAGDPYASPGEEVSLVGLINALSYLAPSIEVSQNPSAAFLCNPAELAELMEKHVVAALCALSSLQLLLTSSPSRGSLRGAVSNRKSSGFKAGATAITLLSSPSSHTSLPGADKESVIAQATAAGIEVIRREAEERSSHDKKAASSSSSFAPPRRLLRVTTVEIDEGTPWGYAARPCPIAEGDGTGPSTSNITGGSSAPTTTTAMRPANARKASSSLTWPPRDTSTQLVLSRVTSLLLTPDPTSRLKAAYRIYLPTEREASYWGQAQAWWNRGTQRLMRIFPTAWVDVLLSLRRHVSLRRAGLIGQGPRLSRVIPQGPANNSQSKNNNLSRSTASQGGSRRPGASASFLAPPTSTRGFYYPTGSASTSGPPSLPDSNSGESASHGDTEDGMVSSGVLDSHSEPEGDEGRPTMERSSTEMRECKSNATIAPAIGEAASAEEGPWMGPDEPGSEEHEADRQLEHDHEHGEEDGDQGEGSAYVGESWIALGESSRRERED